MSWEISNEKFALALESTPGTAVTPPTHILSGEGSLDPKAPRVVGKDKRGILAATFRSKAPKKWGEWSLSASMDTTLFPVLANMGIAVVSTPTTPSGGTLTREWEFVRAMTGNNLKAGTFYFGDPGVKILQGAYGLCKEIGISANGKGDDEVQWSASGFSQFPTKLGSAPTWPAFSQGSMMVPMDFEIYIDPAATIGTTKITGEGLGWDVKIPTGRQEKFIPTGPAGSRTYTGSGVSTQSPTADIELMIPAMTRFDHFFDEDLLGVRMIAWGDEIESGFNEKVEIDIYGYFGDPSWDEFVGTNRSIKFPMVGHYDETLGSDLRIAVWNARTSL